MTDLKTSQETIASDLTGPELVRIVQTGSNAAATATQFKSFIAPGLLSAWTPYTAIVTPGVGAITTQTGSAAYLQIGKIVFVRIYISVTDIGTAANTQTINLPVIPSSVPPDQILMGYATSPATGATISIIQAFPGTLTSGFILDATGGGIQPHNNSIFRYTGSYEAA